MDTPQDPYALLKDRLRGGRAELARMRSRAEAGRPPDPEELARLRRRCQEEVQALAARLGLGWEDVSEDDLDPAGLAVLDQAIELGKGVIVLGLELARKRGPLYLPRAREGDR